MPPLTADATPAPLDDSRPVDMDDYMAGYRQAQSDATSAPHDCFWDAQPIRTTGKPTDIESLRVDVTDDEAELLCPR